MVVTFTRGEMQSGPNNNNPFPATHIGQIAHLLQDHASAQPTLLPLAPMIYCV